MAEFTSSHTDHRPAQAAGHRLYPLGPLPALLLFLGAGVAVRLSIYHFLPFLERLGASAYQAFIVSFTVPLAILFALAFAAVKQEGVPMTVHALAARFRLRRLTWPALGWTLAALVAVLFGGVLLAPTRAWVLQWFPSLVPPAGFPPLLDPLLQNANLPAVLNGWLGPQHTGDTAMVLTVWVLFFFNIFGEELFWRGVVLPRQELIHGRWTWLVHGLMWNLFHLPVYPWYLIYGLPMTLALSFVAQKTGNTWAAILVHGITNLTMSLLLSAALLGAL